MNLLERKYEDDLLEEQFEVVGMAVPCVPYVTMSADVVHPHVELWLE